MVNIETRNSYFANTLNEYSSAMQLVIASETLKVIESSGDTVFSKFLKANILLWESRLRDRKDSKEATVKFYEVAKDLNPTDSSDLLLRLYCIRKALCSGRTHGAVAPEFYRDLGLLLGMKEKYSKSAIFGELNASINKIPADTPQAEELAASVYTAVGVQSLIDDKLDSIPQSIIECRKMFPSYSLCVVKTHQANPSAVKNIQDPLLEKSILMHHAITSLAGINPLDALGAVAFVTYY